jgi:transcriptional regulator of acetoin/glycerol metabolism
LNLPTLEDVKRRAIMDALETCDGDVVLAAKKLGIGRSTLYQYLVDQKYRPLKRAAARKKGKP